MEQAVLAAPAVDPRLSEVVVLGALVGGPAALVFAVIAIVAVRAWRGVVWVPGRDELSTGCQHCPCHVADVCDRGDWDLFPLPGALSCPCQSAARAA